jgi:hypothetical protein
MQGSRADAAVRDAVGADHTAGAKRVCLMADYALGYQGESVQPELFWVQIDDGPKVELRSNGTGGTWMDVTDSERMHEVALFRHDQRVRVTRLKLEPGAVIGLNPSGIQIEPYAPRGFGCD